MPDFPRTHARTSHVVATPFLSEEKKERNVSAPWRRALVRVRPLPRKKKRNVARAAGAREERPRPRAARERAPADRPRVARCAPDAMRHVPLAEAGHGHEAPGNWRDRRPTSLLLLRTTAVWWCGARSRPAVMLCSWGTPRGQRGGWRAPGRGARRGRLVPLPVSVTDAGHVWCGGGRERQDEWSGWRVWEMPAPGAGRVRSRRACANLNAVVGP